MAAILFSIHEQQVDVCKIVVFINIIKPNCWYMWER